MNHKTDTPMNIPQNIWRSGIGKQIKTELARRQISYQQLTNLLRKQGAPYNETYLTQRIRRGDLSAVLLLQILQVLQISKIDTQQIAQVVMERHKRKQASDESQPIERKKAQHA